MKNIFTMRLTLSAFFLLLLLGTFNMSKADVGTAYDFTFQSIEGDPLPLSNFKGKVLLIVNTASKCGFTPQYEGLQAIWDKYKDRGFVVLGVPSNDFGKQEPGNKDEIQEFCEVNFGINFPLTEKNSVSGKDAHPFYKWAKQELGFMAAPKWNFHKYLIDPEGKLVDWFATTTAPTSAKVTGKIESLLP
jgi:glutathione peroxidase